MTAFRSACTATLICHSASCRNSWASAAAPIQNVLIAVKGKLFSELRDDLFLARVHSVLISRPGSTIKELPFEIGYRSPRSFARAVRRVCDASPRQLRSLIADELVASKT